MQAVGVVLWGMCLMFWIPLAVVVTLRRNRAQGAPTLTSVLLHGIRYGTIGTGLTILALPLLGAAVISMWNAYLNDGTNMPPFLLVNPIAWCSYGLVVVVAMLLPASIGGVSLSLVLWGLWRVRANLVLLAPPMGAVVGALATGAWVLLPNALLGGGGFRTVARDDWIVFGVLAAWSAPVFAYLAWRLARVYGSDMPGL